MVGSMASLDLSNALQSNDIVNDHRLCLNSVAGQCHLSTCSLGRRSCSSWWCQPLRHFQRDLQNRVLRRTVPNQLALRLHVDAPTVVLLTPSLQNSFCLLVGAIHRDDLETHHSIEKYFSQRTHEWRYFGVFQRLTPVLGEQLELILHGEPLLFAGEEPRCGELFVAAFEEICSRGGRHLDDGNGVQVSFQDFFAPSAGFHLHTSLHAVGVALQGAFNHRLPVRILQGDAQLCDLQVLLKHLRQELFCGLAEACEALLAATHPGCQFALVALCQGLRNGLDIARLEPVPI
mmetsp:Transcript_25686/g.55825  ORF Transcript_25686/g.55825 Transcript_25686/m.55825 type:complete len:290 (+) Transcript_25686:161-1030(+)